MVRSACPTRAGAAVSAAKKPRARWETTDEDLFLDGRYVGFVKEDGLQWRWFADVDGFDSGEGEGYERDRAAARRALLRAVRKEKSK